MHEQDNSPGTRQESTATQPQETNWSEPHWSEPLYPGHLSLAEWAEQEGLIEQEANENHMDNEVPAGTPHNAPGPNDRAALTPEGAAIGMWWEMPDNAAERDFPDAVLHQEDVPKVWASVAMERGLRGMVAEIGTFGAERGDLQDNYATLDEGMAAAEGWALLEINREMRSYSSEVKLSEGFLRGIESLAAQRDAQTERGAEMDGGLEL